MSDETKLDPESERYHRIDQLKAAARQYKAHDPAAVAARIMKETGGGFDAQESVRLVESLKTRQPSYFQFALTEEQKQGNRLYRAMELAERENAAEVGEVATLILRNRSPRPLQKWYCAQRDNTLAREAWRDGSPKSRLKN